MSENEISEDCNEIYRVDFGSAGKFRRMKWYFWKRDNFGSAKCSAKFLQIQILD